MIDIMVHMGVQPSEIEHVPWPLMKRYTRVHDVKEAEYKKLADSLRNPMENRRG